ncbi:MAG: hypothetical protein RR348_02320, partial [Clostridia bacterium]
AIGIGTIANHLRELADAYKEAQVAIEVGKVFDTEKSILSYENLGIGRLIYQLPTTLCEIFLSEVFKKNSIDSLDQETLFTINKFFENNGIFGKVSKATLDKYAAQAATLGVSVGHMKMILRAADMYADKTLEQLAALPTDELVQLIKDGNADICNSIKQQLKEKEEALKVKYAEMITLTKEVDELRKQIDTFVGTSADKMALVSTMTVKIARIAELTVQYTSDMATEIEKAKVDSAALREQQKTENKLRIEQNKAKFEKHKNDFENNHKQIKDEIKNWRKQGNK